MLRSALLCVILCAHAVAKPHDSPTRVAVGGVRAHRRSALLLAAACAPESAAPLRESTRLFKVCRIGDEDVHVAAFAAAARHFLAVLALFGAYTRVHVQAATQNLHIVEALLQSLPKEASSSARKFLEHDKAQSKHKPGGVLDKDSPAEGLLWLRRGISIWLATFEEHIASPRSLREEAKSAYRRTVEPYNSWLMQKAVSANFVLAPSWDWMIRQGKLASSEEQLLVDMKAWVAVVSPVLQRLTMLHNSLDLEDVRKAS